MTKKWISLNVALLLVAALLAWYLRGAITEFSVDNDIAKIQPGRDLKKATGPEALPPLKPARRYEPAEYQVIAAQNVFTETRTREDKTDSAQVQEAPPLAVKPVLMGVTLTGSQRMALIVDPSVTGTGRKTQTKRPGDSFQGYIITEITNSQMVLENGSRREVIPLYDGSKRPTQGGKTSILATRIVNFGAGSAPAAGVPVRTVSTAVAQPRPIGGQGQPAIVPAGQAVSTPAPDARTTPQGRQVPGPPQGGMVTTDSQGRTVIRTPFGDIVRPARPDQ